MTTDPQSHAPDSGRWLAQVGLVLDNLGFELVEPDRTGTDDTAHLLVALRAQATQHHFDPEEINYWVSESGRGKAASMDRETRFPVASEFAWGRITLTDRLGVKNEFLSFGGAVRAQIASDSVAYIDFSSHAPILRWSGHSQGSDPLAAEVGAFFGRVKVPIDFVPGAEALVARAAPSTLYCSFIQHVRERMAAAPTLRETNRWLADWVSHEGHRMEADSIEHWKAATELRRQLSAIEAIARE
jgi:hypothetical protein